MWSFPQTKRAVSSLLSSEESPPTRPFPSPLPSPQVVGLRALLAVVTTVTESSAARSSTAPAAASLSSLARGTISAANQGLTERQSVDFGRMGARLSESAVLAPHLPRVRAALGSIVKQCHASFGSLLLITPKATLGRVSVFYSLSSFFPTMVATLRCLPKWQYSL